MIVPGDARPPRLLLDTCAVVYLFNGEAMASDAVAVIEAGQVLVSPISAWEIGILAQKRGPSVPVFSPDPTAWFNGVLAAPRVSPAPFDADIALASCSLPGQLHRDPADRFLIATARRLALPIVTRDRLILAYAEDGHVDAVPC